MQRHTVPRIRRFFRRIKSRPPRSRFSHTHIRGDPIRRYAAMPGGHVRNCRLSIHDRIFQGVRSFGRNPKPSCEKAVPCPHVAPYRRVPTESFRSLSPDRTTAIRLPGTVRRRTRSATDRNPSNRTALPTAFSLRPQEDPNAGGSGRPPAPAGGKTRRQADTPASGTPSRRPHPMSHKTLHIKYLPCKNRRSPEGVPAHAGLSSCRSARLSFM